MIKKIIGALLVIGIVLPVVAFVTYRNFISPPKIKIVNDSQTELENIVFRTSGGSESVPNILPARTRTVLVHPKGESGLGVSFTALGKNYEKEVPVYIESHGGYRVSLLVNEK